VYGETLLAAAKNSTAPRGRWAKVAADVPVVPDIHGAAICLDADSAPNNDEK